MIILKKNKKKEETGKNKKSIDILPTNVPNISLKIETFLFNVIAVVIKSRKSK